MDKVRDVYLTPCNAGCVFQGNLYVAQIGTEEPALPTVVVQWPHLIPKHIYLAQR